MIIECLIKRKGGTMVTLDHESYHFSESEESAAHVAEVKNKAHIGILLAITEGFVEFGKQPVKKAVEKPKPKVLDPETMTNKELIDWGRDHGFNPANKGSIQDYAANYFGVELDDKKNPVGMIRDLVTLEAGRQQ